MENFLSTLKNEIAPGNVQVGASDSYGSGPNGRANQEDICKGLHHEFPAALSRWGSAEVVFIFY